MPRAKVYSTLDDLASKGLAEIIPTRPRTYHPIPFAQYIKHEQDQVAQRLEQLENDLQAADAILAPGDQDPPIPTGEVRLYRTRKRSVHQVTDVLSNTTNLHYYGSIPSTHRLLYHEPDLNDLLDGDGEVRLLLQHHPDNASAVTDAIPDHLHAHTRTTQHGPYEGYLLIGDDLALLSHAHPDDTHTFVGEDLVLTTDDPTHLSLLRSLYHHAWLAGHTP